MYPAYLRKLLRRRERTPRVFVAMPFGEAFEARFTSVIEPAITSLKADDIQLGVHRVDRGGISDSLITEIVSGIENDVLVLADITSIGMVGEQSVRNGNVMYEVGLAHAMRPPEHVLLFRSDQDPLLFDVSGIRVRHYDPDKNPDAARATLRQALLDASLTARQFELSETLEAARGLDFISWCFLARMAGIPAVAPEVADLEVALRNTLYQPALHRLLALGLIESRVKKVFHAKGADPAISNTSQMFDYELTPLGTEVFLVTLHKSGIAEITKDNPDLKKHYEEMEAELRTFEQSVGLEKAPS